MSNRKAAPGTVRFLPVDQSLRPARATGYLLFGVIYPAVVIGFELVSRMCAQGLFDPMPTAWHTAAVASVPLANLAALTLLSKRHAAKLPPAGIAFANAAVIAIAAFYALLFLPLMPVAIIAIPMGLGLLPLAPLSSLVAAVLLRRALRREAPGIATGRILAAGLVSGLALLLALDARPAATRLGLQWAGSEDRNVRERGVRLIRNVGDREMLLRLCYDAAARPTGLLTAILLVDEAFVGRNRAPMAVASTNQAREIYYRVTGEPFNARTAPFMTGRWDRFADFAFDNDHGGSIVGGRLQGLTLASSRIDGSIAADDAVGYLEWTFEFKNVAPVDREARVQLALPPGAVVSRATLWVNGEEREAAYGGRAEVRAAYQKIAVQQRRDPLLVTTKGADRVLAQAFPVPRNGGTIRFKIGMTAPLDVSQPATARLVLPAILDRNFSFSGEAPHAVWIDAKRPVSVEAPGLSTRHVSDSLHRVSGLVPDADLAQRRVSIVAERAAVGGPVVARIGEGAAVLQEIVQGGNAPPAALMIVVDGSARAKAGAEGLVAALDAIPAAARVGLMIAGSAVAHLPVAAWTEERKQAAIRLVRAQSFAGGEDNAPAIADALMALEPEENAALLWVHGPQPITFSSTAQRLEQTGSRLTRLPRVTLYATEPGPNELLPDAPWAWAARSLPATGAPVRDLTVFIRTTLANGPAFEVRRRGTDTVVDGLPRGSEHIARLWAADRVQGLMREAPHGSRRAEAVALASEFRLVTPVSGAVVLETAKQFEDANLKPVAQGTVPTVPEPHEWALMLMALAAMTWTLWRHRARIGGMA